MTDTRTWIGTGAVALVLLLMPIVASDFFVSFVLTRTLILGIGAASIVFLFRYAGMISLAQFLIFGVAAFMIGNAVGQGTDPGLRLGMGAWAAVVFALVVSLAIALILGALAARTYDIYFLMLTLTYAVIGFFLFLQVTSLSGSGGVTGVRPAALDGDIPLYVAAVISSVVTYIGFKALARTPFGIALQGIRDDPVRMASLGFNVPLHRTLGFAAAGLVAAVAGILYIWWNGQIAPSTIALGPSLDLLIIAVIGGISFLEGAWVGSFVYVAANIYLRNVPFVDNIGLTEARFRTVVGLLVLAIMVLSPEGIMGIFERTKGRLTSRREAGAIAPAGGDL